MMTQNYLQLRFQKIWGHLLTSVGIKHPHVTDMYIQTKHLHMLTKEIYKRKRKEGRKKKERKEKMRKEEKILICLQL